MLCCDVQPSHCDKYSLQSEVMEFSILLILSCFVISCRNSLPHFLPDSYSVSPYLYIEFFPVVHCDLTHVVILPCVFHQDYKHTAVYV